jgi:hypothetical protein
MNSPAPILSPPSSLSASLERSPSEKLKSVDFAALASEWLADEEQSMSLSRFALRLLPQALSAIEEPGLRSFMAPRAVEQIEALELAPLAAELISAFEDRAVRRPSRGASPVTKDVSHPERPLRELRSFMIS